MNILHNKLCWLTGQSYEKQKIVDIKMQNYDKRVIQANWIYDSKNLNLVRKEILVSGGETQHMTEPCVEKKNMNESCAGNST